MSLIFSRTSAALVLATGFFSTAASLGCPADFPVDFPALTAAGFSSCERSSV
jgi:hypothetical protein